MCCDAQTHTEICVHQINLTNVQTRSNYRIATGKVAETDAHLFSEKEKSKNLKKRCDELKAALRKLAALKESGEYQAQHDATVNSSQSSKYKSMVCAGFTTSFSLYFQTTKY